MRNLNQDYSYNNSKISIFICQISIYEHKEWLHFSWNKECVGEELNKVHKAAGYLTGHLSVIGFDNKICAVVGGISQSMSVACLP